jgi:hypothetical protein
MKNTTRALFSAYVSQIALINGVSAADADKHFAVAPAVEQKLEERMKQSSEFLQAINIVGVDAQEGDKVGIGVTRTMASRTNTAAGNRRVPTNAADSADLGRYRCEKTDFDYAFKYSLLDAWAHRPEFQQLMTNAIRAQEGRDHIMIGWNGTSVAVATDRVANPLLQDVNKGWLYKIRTFAPERVLNDGSLTVKSDGTNNAALKRIYVADGTLYDAGLANAVTAEADYANLDALVHDAVELMAEWHRDHTDVVVIIGRDLLHDKFQNVINAAGDNAMQMEARDRILTLPKMVGGKRAIVVPFFPANAVLITKLSNLSIYLQNGSRRRLLREEPDLDQVANYESVNVAYVVEDYEACAFVENIVLGKSPARIAA